MYGNYYHWLLFDCDRRQEEIVTPKLLACAMNGAADELFQLLDDGDNINPKVDYCPYCLKHYTILYYSVWQTSVVQNKA